MWTFIAPVFYSSIAKLCCSQASEDISSSMLAMSKNPRVVPIALGEDEDADVELTEQEEDNNIFD